jgi:exonuclease SbcD
MRLLHTSDWHLGLNLLGVPMIDHQRAFVDWLVDLVRDREVDAVLVAGDVYDRAIPPTDAIDLLERALLDLSALCPVVVISGNHDSATRLGFGGRLMEAAHVHLRSGIDDLDRPVPITGRDGTTALVYGLPYLEPDAMHAALGAERSHEAVLTAAMGRVRVHLDAQREAARRSGTAEPRAVAMAHAFIAGGSISESERDVTVGGIADAPAAVFDGVDYVALGHLHRPQEVRGGPPARYSGTPLAYSFSEESHEKSVTLVDLASDGTVVLATEPTPVPRRLATISGPLDHLLSSPDLASVEDAWVRARLTDAVRPENPMERLRTRFPNTIQLLFEGPADLAGPIGAIVDPRTADPLQVVEGFIEHVSGEPAAAGALALAQDSLERLRAREAG